MILGLAAGRWLKADLQPGERIRKLFTAGPSPWPWASSCTSPASARS